MVKEREKEGITIVNIIGSKNMYRRQKKLNLK